MSPADQLQALAEVLTRWELAVEVDAEHLEVPPVDEAGFAVSLWPREEAGDVIVAYGRGWHEHCDGWPEALDGFVAGLAEDRRVLEARRGGRPYRWRMETRSEDAGWDLLSAVGKLFWRPWGRRTVHALSNSHLPPSRCGELAVELDRALARPAPVR